MPYPSPCVAWPSHAVVVDLVYAQGPTPLVESARASGVRVVDGREVLLAQVERQFTRMTGLAPPPGLVAERLGLAPRITVGLTGGTTGTLIIASNVTAIGAPASDFTREFFYRERRRSLIMRTASVDADGELVGRAAGLARGRVRRPRRPIRPGGVLSRRGLRRPVPRRAPWRGRAAIARGPRAGPRRRPLHALDDHQGAGQGRHGPRPLLGGARQLADAAHRPGRRPAEGSLVPRDRRTRRDLGRLERRAAGADPRPDGPIRHRRATRRRVAISSTAPRSSRPARGARAGRSCW